MAPNKKKRKPTASNPARGFATTSVASKQKAQETELSPLISEQTDVRSESELCNAHDLNHNVVSDRDLKPEKQLHELSPEELEAHLEESDLQAFLEKHGEKVKRDASRQVARLKTERRLLRAQAQPLRTRPWLQSEIITQVQDHISEESVLFRSSFNTPSSASPPPPSNGDILLQVWRVFLILSELGFSLHDTEEAVNHLLKRNYFYTNNKSPKIAKDGVRGLDESLDLLALKLAKDKALGYNEQEKAVLEQEQDSSEADTLRKLSISFWYHYLTCGSENL